MVMSLVLCVACGVLWTRSITRCDSAGYTTRAENTCTFSTGPHVLVFNTVLIRGDVKTPLESLVTAMYGRPGGGIRVHSDKWDASLALHVNLPRVINLPQGGVIDLGDLNVSILNTWIPPAHRFFGFGYDSAQQGALTVSRAELPLWTLMLVFAALPAVRFKHAIQLCRRRRLGLCLTCGYDLRASKDRCPECGTAITGQGEV